MTEMLEDFLLHPDLTVRFFRLLIDPPGNLNRDIGITRKCGLVQTGLQFGLIHTVPLDPSGQMVFRCQMVRLGTVATIVGKDEVVPEISRVSRPRNKVIHLRLQRQRFPTVQSGTDGGSLLDAGLNRQTAARSIHGDVVRFASLPARSPCIQKVTTKCINARISPTGHGVP